MRIGVAGRAVLGLMSGMAVVALASCAVPVSGGATSPAADCAGSAASVPGASELLVTPAELCAGDGAPWRLSDFTTVFEFFEGFASTDPECAATGLDPAWALLDVRERMHALYEVEGEDGSALVAVIEDDATARAGAEALDLYREACADTPPVEADGTVDALSSIEAEGWSGLRYTHDDLDEPSLSRDLETYWIGGDGWLAVIQADADLDDRRLAGLLDRQRAGLPA